MNYNVFDIETGPLPVEQLEDMMPQFFAPSNWKDEAKIDSLNLGNRASPQTPNSTLIIS